MWFGLANPSLLLGLLALSIPVLIHFLQRRRFDVVDWGAMQFLHVAPSVRRRWRWDQALLLLLRLILLTILVLALAGIFVQYRGGRVFVLILDRSASMGRHDARPWEEAQAWLNQFLNHLEPEDRVTLILAGQPPEVFFPEATSDVPALRAVLKGLPPPYGGSDFPRALTLARDALSQSGSPGHLYLLRDGQQAGWADAGTLAQWENLASSWTGPGAPSLSLVEFPDAAEDQTLNFWLGPLHVPLGVLRPNQQVTVTSPLHWQGRGPLPLAVELIARVNGEETLKWLLPPAAAKSPATLSFPLQISKPGRHLVSLELKTLPKKGSGNALSEDDRQHAVVEVVHDLPVLLVEGDAKLSPAGTTFFLENVLKEDTKTAPLFAPTPLPWKEVSPDLLRGKNGFPSRVVILSDVPRLSAAQGEALEQFLVDGGGVLIGLGPRSAGAMDFFNGLHGNGLGWFPVKLERVEGTEGKLEQAAGISIGGLSHPALEYFQGPARLLNRAKFPCWLSVSPARDARVIATLDTGQPFLVEKSVGKGRVLVCTTPLDASWGTHFPKVESYPILIQQLLLYLAEAGTTSWRLAPGQVVQWMPPRGEKWEAPANAFWQTPGEEALPVVIHRLPWAEKRVHQVGPYALTWGPGRKAWFVVPPDLKESDPTPLEEKERALHGLLPWNIVTEPHPPASSLSEERADNKAEIWWALLLAVILLLCLEIWYTRRMALKQGGP